MYCFNLLLSFYLLQEDAISPREQELRDLKDSLQDTQPVGALVKCCKTLDQVSHYICVFMFRFTTYYND